LTTVESESPGRLYRPDIDGIRAIAILSVALYHANVPLFTGGFTGVDIFFVLSGYLIGGHIFSELRTGNFSFLRFYQRRAKRILPAFFFVLAFVLVAGLFLLSPLSVFHLTRAAVWATLSVSNIVFWRSSGYFDTGNEFNPLLMTWSLGVEEQFYAVIPLLMVLLTRIRRNWLFPSILAVCVLSFLFACLALRDYPSLVFYLLPARAWELGVGVALAVIEISRKGDPLTASKLPGLSTGMSLIGLAAILAPIFVFTKATPFPGAAAIPSVLGTALLLTVPYSWINRRLLSLPPLVYIGRVSYSWYLWHWPLLSFTHILYGNGTPPLTVTLGAIAAAFAAAVLSYYVIEQPLRRSRRAPVPLLLRYAAVTLLFLMICTVVGKSHGFAWRYPELTRMEAAIEARGTDPCVVSDGGDQPNLSSACYDRSVTGPSVAILGDSHSEAIAPGLRSVANGSGYEFVQFSKAGCLPLIGAVRYTPAQPRETAECVRFNQRALDLLKADTRIRIVVLCGFWANPLRLNVGETWLTVDLAGEREVPTLEASRRIFTQSLSASIRSLQAAGKQVLVFGDTPSFEFEPFWKVTSARIPARRILSRWLRVPGASDPGFAQPDFVASDVLATSLLKETLAGIPSTTSGEAPNPQLVDLKPAFCQMHGQCAYRDGDQLLYSDGHHLTADGAYYALRGFHLPAITLANNQ
jgi:peptidoglycan/LPS O-acetylase OafA/YrhL